MARKPRMYLPGIPTHVLQRGNNRSPCFFRDEDYAVYLDHLREGLERYGIQLHAYVLLPERVHLLMTPETEFSISRLMQHVGRRYVAYVNKARGRTGTLWEGRHKASLIQADHYLLACYRYIEMLPVVEQIAPTADDYRWSSYGRNAWGRSTMPVSDHALYGALGATSIERQRAYRKILRSALPEPEFSELRSTVECNYPLGSEKFRKEIESLLGRAIGEGKRGRPILQH